MTLFGGRRRGELSGSVGDTEFFRAHGSTGEVWDEEMSSSMLGSRLRKVVQNYQVGRFASMAIFKLAHLFPHSLYSERYVVDYLGNMYMEALGIMHGK